VIFHRLSRLQMDRIVEIQIARLQGLLKDRNIAIALDEKARSWLANAGYDPIYGARPLKRVVQRNLQNPLAELILEGSVKDGDQVSVSATDRGLTINGREAARKAA